MSSTPAPRDLKAGSLAIAGSGIASVSHMTLETLAHIQEADVVFYVVADPVTEAFIQKNAKGPCKDLHILFDKDKMRYDTYVQMAEMMLNPVREGQKALGIFYGHPGVFVSPSRRALSIARKEGYEAKMLPGISSEDYMFADLEVDPAVHGCSAYEATQLLLRDIALDTAVSNIIWQVGGVGISKIDFENSKVKLLVDRLEKDFGPDHRIVHYIGAVLPQSTTTRDVLKISDLRNEHVVTQLSSCSTLYIPPLNHDDTFSGDMVKQLFGEDVTGVSAALCPTPKWAVESHPSDVPEYGPREQAAVDAMVEHIIPADYRALGGSPAFRLFMIDLALHPEMQAKYNVDPAALVDATEGLTPVERASLLLRQPGPVFAIMKPLASDQITEENVKDYPIVPVSLNNDSVVPPIPTSLDHVAFTVAIPASLNHTAFIDPIPASFNHTAFTIDPIPTSLNHTAFTIDPVPASLNHTAFTLPVPGASLNYAAFAVPIPASLDHASFMPRI